MSRHAIPWLVSFVLLGPTHAEADTFAGWRYAAPPGYTTETAADHVAMTKASSDRFCSIAIFEPRKLEQEARVEASLEWFNVVSHQFTPKVVRRDVLKTLNGPVATTTATLVAADGTRYAGIPSIVMPPGMIGSVLLTSTTHTSLASCAKPAADVVRSLELDWSAPRFTDPEARVETPVGRWASVGTTNREYTFLASGSYRFHSETTGPDPLLIVDESGTYKLLGNQLTLVPTTSYISTVTKGAGRSHAGKLEKATYSWSKTYAPGTNEWRIQMTPKKATARDGALRATGYSYSDLVTPSWRFVSAPGA